MRIRYLLAATVASAMLIQGTDAQGQTLQEALGIAYDSNPTLQAARAAVRRVDENVPQALSGWRPRVSVTGTTGWADGTRTSRSTNAFNGRTTVNRQDAERNPTTLQGTVTQPIYQGGRTTSTVNRTERQVLAERGRLIASEQQVLLDGITAYANVIRETAVLTLSTNNVTVLGRQLQATNDRFRVGEITRTDVAQAEARLEGARSERARAAGELESARANYQRIIGQVPVNLREPPPLNPLVQSREEAADLASRNNPQVVAAQFDELSELENIRIQLADLLPQLSLQGSIFRNDDQAERDVRSTGSQIIANLTVPIFQGGAEYARVRQARQEALRRRQLVDETRRAAADQGIRAFETLGSAQAQVTSTRAQIRANEIALDGVQREAVVGSRTTLDVLNAEQELLNSRVSLVRAQRDVVVASYSIASAIGRLTAKDLQLSVTYYDPEVYYRGVRNRWFGLYGPDTAQAASVR